MVEHRDVGLDRTFAALSHPTRRTILGRLRSSEATISELAGPFRMSFNAVSKHVKALEQAGLVRRRVRGRQHYCALAPAPLRRATTWLDEYRVFWDERLDALDAFLRRTRAARRQGTLP
jgi:DNA-binding transcriptional ArsR family regulator